MYRKQFVLKNLIKFAGLKTFFFRGSQRGSLQIQDDPPLGTNIKWKLKMYAIVEIAGQQFKVEKEQKLFVHRLHATEGEQLEFDKVLLLDNEGEVAVGTPEIEGAKVVAKVLSHLKADKVKVFKKKRRKGYRKLNGHRQQLTQIEIENILA